jgi:hypothetical protein
VCFLQLVFQARRAQSACFATVTLREVMTTGWAIELGGGHRVAVCIGGRFRAALDALFTDDLVAPHAESGHRCSEKAYAE